MVLKMLPTIRSILKITVQSTLIISELSFLTVTSLTSLLCSVWITAIICDVTGRRWNMMKPVQISWITSAEMTVRISSSMVIMPIHPISRKLRFTPLAQLLQQENYEANKTVYLLLENEVREYVICSVYYTDLISSDGVYYTQYEEQYNLADFYEDYFSTYHDRVKSKQLYETGEDFSYADHLLTLQTCVENRPDQREIIVCRQVNIYPITDRCDFAMREMIDSERAG